MKDNNVRPSDMYCSGKRRRGPSKTALRFEYGGEDMTCLEQRLTQAAIDRVLASDLLVRAAFHGQSDMTALLEVSPAPAHGVVSVHSNVRKMVRA